jgi:hypothetical protein
MTHTLDDLRAGRLAGARRLDLACGLREFPREIFELADTLEVLNLTGNQLDALPDELPRLRQLRVLFCSHNRFTQVPPAVAGCERLETLGLRANRIERVDPGALPPGLRSLVLTENRLDHLPAGLGRLQALQKLMLTGNALQDLPADLAGCERLELLRIAANRFEALPAWLLELPSLAWLACAGNPLSDAAEAQAIAAHPIAAIDWATLVPGALLGQGASGVIHRATAGDGSEVAVKLFKGDITSDGLPHSEMAAFIAAQPHPRLTEVLGRVTGHPEGREGLVMRLIEPGFRTLAAPPSLESCTRDVYDAAQRFSPTTAHALLHGLADALRHLHASGITHGDLYAHNVLWRAAQGGHADDALLSDFGAAAFVPPGATADALERIEVRAFGILMDEVLAHCEPAPRPALAVWRERCLQREVQRRPSFAELAQGLQPGA